MFRWTRQDEAVKKQQVFVVWDEAADPADVCKL